MLETFLLENNDYEDYIQFITNYLITMGKIIGYNNKKCKMLLKVMNQSSFKTKAESIKQYALKQPKIAAQQ